MIIHDNSHAAKYFVKGLDYVNSLPRKKKGFKREKTPQDDKGFVNQECLIIIGTTRKSSIDFIADMLIQKQSTGLKMDQIMIVIVDYFKDSMIRSKYIKGKLLRGNKTKESPFYVFVEFNEVNQIIMIEDDYNQSFSYKDLSRHYKKQLQLVVEYQEKSVNNKVDQGIKPLKKGGRDLANSTMV